MISTQEKEHLFGKTFEVKVSYKSVLKLFVLNKDAIMWAHECEHLNSFWTSLTWLNGVFFHQLWSQILHTHIKKEDKNKHKKKKNKNNIKKKEIRIKNKNRQIEKNINK